MADAPEPSKKSLNPTAESQNWELRVRTELESNQKWNNDWGTLFPNKVPNELQDRVVFLEQQLKEKPTDVLPRSSIGFYAPLKDVGKKDHRRKKMFGDGGVSLAELAE